MIRFALACRPGGNADHVRDSKKKEEEQQEIEDTTPPAPLPQQPKKLKGGMGKKSGGAQFGLKW